MTAAAFTIPDNTPIIIATGQIIDRLHANSGPPYHPPVELAAQATEVALADANTPALRGLIDTIAVLRLFSDSVGAWAAPLGRSDNPPASVANRIGAKTGRRIYTNTGGTQPLQLLMELALDIARGESEVALLTGAEAIGSEKHARRGGHQDDWNEHFDTPYEDREYLRRFACEEERNSGMTLPAHYYSLIENAQAHAMGYSTEQHRQFMARLLAPMSEVAAHEPVALHQKAYSVEQLASNDPGNYPITLPLTKMLVSQDAVNQGASILLTSTGKARELGIPPSQWVFLQGYAQGLERHLMRRIDPGQSTAMKGVFDAALSMAGAQIENIDMLDIYSCFPSAVNAACHALNIAADDPRPLTIIGGLPFFGGAGNGYSLHAVARMARRLRGNNQRGVVTANTGVLSKHALAVLSNAPAIDQEHLPDWSVLEAPEFDLDSIPEKPISSTPTEGRLIAHTIIYQRNKPDLAIALGETHQGERFLAHSLDPAVASELHEQDVIGRRLKVAAGAERHSFSFAG